jgi:NAD(P)H-hydrate repair Nnr-like enzyme with NAD(P)H-hydrate epimerase domain
MDPLRYGYTLQQLMELAGQAVAHSILDAFPDAQRILILCGPGKNTLSSFKFSFWL